MSRVDVESLARQVYGQEAQLVVSPTGQQAVVLHAEVGPLAFVTAKDEDTVLVALGAALEAVRKAG